MLTKLLRIVTLLPLLIVADDLPKNQTKFIKTNGVNSKNITFKDYLQKFQPQNVWEKIDKKNKVKGIKKTVAEEFDAILNGIDETDELLSLKVENGQPKIVLQEDGRRRWRPPNKFSSIASDRYSIKRRVLELMKQAIYQTRYKMVTMQIMRDKYRKNSVYKMGFLMSKTDMTCKKFSAFAYKALMDCSVTTKGDIPRYPVIDILAALERLQNIWFEIDLLIDLVIKNDENCKKMLSEVITNRKNAWKFVD